MYYYKFNISDWHLATSHLSLEEEAVYFKLINYYYDTEKPIPEETQSVIRRLRLGKQSTTVTLILGEFFTLEGDGWHHARCDDEIEKYHQKAEVNQKVGKLGGRPRKINDLGDNPQITQSVSKNNPQITLTKNQEPLTKNHIISVAKATKAQRLSKDFILPTEWIEFCRTERKDLSPESVFAQFKDYWIAQGGQKGAKLDWFATWRNWVRNTKATFLKTQDKPVEKRWFDTIDGIKAKGAELGIDPSGCATIGQYEDMIRKAM